MSLLSVEDLRVYFHTHKGIVRAVDGLSFNLEAGQCLGIVGESGSGKSAAMMALLGLLPMPPAKIEGGHAYFGGSDLLRMSEKSLQHIRGNKIAMVFQDPMTSLNPYLRISTQLTEVLETHKAIKPRQALAKAIAALERVGIPDASRTVQRYPHQLSGGMRQRVMIAMALLAEAELIIADEPTTALDVTMQAQIMELLREMQRETKLSLILVSHDLGVIAGIADEVLVMYNGRLVETGSVDDIFYNTKHPYTQSLLRALPRLDQEYERLQAIPGLPPLTTEAREGCAFADRCSARMSVCSKAVPWVPLGSKHYALCHLYQQIPAAASKRTERVGG